MPDKRRPSRSGRCRRQTLFVPWASHELCPAHLHFQRDREFVSAPPVPSTEPGSVPLAQCGAVRRQMDEQRSELALHYLACRGNAVTADTVKAGM